LIYIKERHTEQPKYEKQHHVIIDFLIAENYLNDDLDLPCNKVKHIEEATALRSTDPLQKAMKLFLNKSNRTVFFIIFLLLSFTTTLAQVKLVSWNIQNFGKSKSEVEINFIANTLKAYDIIAIQEVVAGYGGAQAVVKLADELNRKGTKWDYVISDTTSSTPYKKERNAFIWKTAPIKKIGKAWLEKKYHLEIDREPFYCTFEYKKKKLQQLIYTQLQKANNLKLR
jgi:hypothetical protein